MAKVSFNGFVLLRQSYSMVAQNVKENCTASVIKKAADMGNNVGVATKKPVPVRTEEFWMRDPKTGNWMPENHFKEVDAVDLRAEILSKKHNI